MVNIKNIFTNYDIDSEYAIAMSYRLVRGDSMFVQMREPHQTSAFLSAVFIQLYLWITGTTTGIVVYLNAVGVVLKGFVTNVIYQTFEQDIDKKTLYYMCLFFFALNPKNILLPEFSNMQIWFAALLLCCLYKYWKYQNKISYLVMAGICLCMEILSYPSCLIIYGIVLWLLWRFSEKKGRDILLLTAECGMVGIGYVLWIGCRIGFFQLWNGMTEMIKGDSSHGSILPDYKLNYYVTEGKVIIEEIVIFAILASIIFGISILFDKIKKQKKKEFDIWLIIFFFFFLAQNFLSLFIEARSYLHYAIYISVLLLGYCFKKYCNTMEKIIFFIGMALGFGNFVSTAILTNLGLYATIPYMVIAVMVCFIPISKSVPEKRGLWILAVMCVAVILRQGLVFKSATDNITSIRYLGGVIKSGPAKGIITDYMGAYIPNVTMDEWKQIIQQGDKVLMVGENVVSTLEYLYQDTVISVDSTICTPTYNEKLLRYWEINPEKYPSVVVVDCWYGEQRIREDSWIFQWLENEYHANEVFDGAYWRYYVKRE